MIIVVPDAGTFASFETGLTVDSLSAVLAGAQPGGGADLIMPRFKFSTLAASDVQGQQIGLTPS